MYGRQCNVISNIVFIWMFLCYFQTKIVMGKLGMPVFFFQKSWAPWYTSRARNNPCRSIAHRLALSATLLHSREYCSKYSKTPHRTLVVGSHALIYRDLLDFGTTGHGKTQNQHVSKNSNLQWPSSLWTLFTVWTLRVPSKLIHLQHLLVLPLFHP